MIFSHRPYDSGFANENLLLTESNVLTKSKYTTSINWVTVSSSIRKLERHSLLMNFTHWGTTECPSLRFVWWPYAQPSPGSSESWRPNVEDSTAWSLFPSDASSLIAETELGNLVNPSDKLMNKIFLCDGEGVLSNPSVLGHVLFDGSIKVINDKTLHFLYSNGKNFLFLLIHSTAE